jgi:hypothetical protein
MERARKMLEAHAETLVGIYQEGTGKTRDAIRQSMKDESWFTGAEAVEWGLGSETNKETVDLTVITPDASTFRRPPQNLVSIWNSRRTQTGVVASAHQQQLIHNSMNRRLILALLLSHGITVSDASTDEKLLAELNGLVTAGKIKRADADVLIGTTAPDATRTAAATATEDLTFLRSSVATLTNLVNQQQASIAKQTRTRIEASVDRAIAERRIPQAQRVSWVTRSLADESVINDLLALPQNIPGETALVEIVSESPMDVLKGIELYRAPMDAACRGQRVEPMAIQRASVAIAQAITKHEAKLNGVMAATTTTISADLKRIVLLQNAISVFRRRLVPLSRFTTIFQNIPLEGTDEIAVPFWPLHTTASTDYVAGNGYVASNTRTLNSIKVTVNKRKYQPFFFTSVEMARQPYWDTARFVNQGVEQLAVDVFTDVLSVVTLANYGAAVLTEPPETFSTDDIADLMGVGDIADWPDVGRVLLLDTLYGVALVKDPDLKNADKSGTDAALRQGSIGSLFRFSDIYLNNRIPTNSQNLKGFMCMPQAIIVATSPIMPAPGVRKQLVAYDVITDEQTGLTFEYRNWGDAQLDTDSEVVECNYGYVKGDPAALKRITSA